MDRRFLYKLCQLLKVNGGLKDNRNMIAEEMVVKFLHIIGHHTKNRVVKCQLARSGETISKHFKSVLRVVFKLHPLLIAKLVAIGKNSSDNRWRRFKVTTLQM